MIDMGLSSIVNPSLVIIMDYLSIKISLMIWIWIVVRSFYLLGTSSNDTSLWASLLLYAAQWVQDWQGIWTNPALGQMVMQMLIWMPQKISESEACMWNILPFTCDCSAALLCTWISVFVPPPLASETIGLSVRIVDSWDMSILEILPEGVQDHAWGWSSWA